MACAHVGDMGTRVNEAITHAIDLGSNVNGMGNDSLAGQGLHMGLAVSARHANRVLKPHLLRNALLSIPCPLCAPHQTCIE
jgi:hypothetical protein